MKRKIVEVLKLQPLKPCESLTKEELIEEEARCRKELVRLVLSLSIHVGTCATHGVLSAGTTLGLHVPVVVWIAYSLTKTARRHRALKLEIRNNRTGIELQKIKTRRFAAPVILGLISPILSALGADIINEIVLVLVGSDTLCSIGLPSSLSDQSGGACAPEDSEYKFVLASGDDNSSNEFNVTEQVSQEAIQSLLEKWAEHVERGVPEDFARLVDDLDLQRQNNRAGLVVPKYYQVHCNACYKQINDGYACLDCDDFDLCRDCYLEAKHPDVKLHDYEEFKIEEEITQIQRIMASLNRDNISVACGRGGYTQCNKCYNLLSSPSTDLKSDLAFYYKCKSCNDFDVCSKCFPEEVSQPIHDGHAFGIIVATDDEATISRLSPATSKLSIPRSPVDTIVRHFKQSPLSSPDLGTGSNSASLFQSTSAFQTVSELYSPSTVRSPVDTLRPTSYWCDGCHKLITGGERLHCTDPACVSSSSVDLHLECVGWLGHNHEDYHHMRVLSTSV